MKDIPHTLVKELAHKIKGYGNPRFAFFLGAGASRQSGIITANEMIQHFKKEIIDRCCPSNAKDDKEKEAWLSQEEWYKSDANEYCKLFERLEQSVRGRQRYIENIIEGREPSFGYVVLANLMASKYINTIITTNFDDLVYSSCATYTGTRPIVYAYGIMASEMRLTTQRPKILKLHGDFLYSKLKNTSEEIEEQDPNMVEQFLHILSQDGLIVVGYSGEDKSVMKILWRISGNDDFYWCIRRGDEPNEKVKELLQAKGGSIVYIDGFDEMMNEICNVVGFDVDKMVGSIKERQTHVIEQFKKFNGRYSAKILGDLVKAITEPIAQKGDNKEIQAVDFFSQGYHAQMEGDLVRAEELYRKVIDLDPNYVAPYNNLVTLLINDAARQKEAEEFCRTAIKLNPDYAVPYYNLSLLLKKDAARQKEAEEFCRTAIKLNPNYVAAHIVLGNLLAEDAARQEEAEQSYRKAIELDPDNALAYNNLIKVLHSNSREADAIPFIERAAQLKPQNPNAP